MSAADDLVEARDSIREARHNLDVLWEMARLKYDGQPDTLDEAVFLIAKDLASANILVTSLLEAELRTPDADDEPIANVERITRSGGRVE